MTTDPASLSGAAQTSRGAFEAAQLQLARMNVSAGKTFRGVLRDVSELVAAALKVDRVGIWLYIDGKHAIRCHHLYQQSRQERFEGTVLHAKDFPTYFRALETSRFVPIADVQSDPLAQEFREPYFKPLGITSMLDTPLYRSGKVIGVMCHEHIGQPRIWTTPESDFAVSVADTVSRLFEEAARLQAETSLEVYQAHLMELQRMEALGRLAAGIAHDFKNVLTAIIGYGDLIARIAHESPQVAELARELLDAAEHGNSLIQELLTFGHDEPVRPCVLDLEKVIQDFINVLRMAAGNNVTLEFSAMPKLGRVFIDSSQLERALLNLVVNAGDAMPSGGRIEIRLREEKVTQESGRKETYVVLEVSDNGMGMDAATRERIFEPFFTTKRAEGTGLGLAIVRQIVAHAGGFIEVDSEPGHGTSIRINLPRIAGHD